MSGRAVVRAARLAPVGGALNDLVPLAIGVAVSPLPVLAVVLMLLSDRGTPNALGFLAGWAFGLVAVLSATAALGLGSGGTDTPTWAAIEVGLGVFLLLLAAVAWSRRPRPGQVREPPRWLEIVERMSPPQALGLGVLLVLINVKDLALTVTAGADLTDAGLEGAQAAAAVAVFAAIGSLSVALPIVIAAVADGGAHRALGGFRAWLERYGEIAVAVTLLVLGIGLIATSAPDL